MADIFHSDSYFATKRSGTEVEADKRQTAEEHFPVWIPSSAETNDRENTLNAIHEKVKSSLSDQSELNKIVGSSHEKQERSVSAYQVFSESNISVIDETQHLGEFIVDSLAEYETHIVKTAEPENCGETINDSIKMKEVIVADEELGIAESKPQSEMQEMVRNDGEKRVGPEGLDASVKCSLKVEFIDGIALIQPAVASHKEIGSTKGWVKNGKQEVDANKDKQSRRRGKSIKRDSDSKGKQSSLTQTAEARVLCNEDGSKIVYSRKEMEALRFVNVEAQREMWKKIYDGLGFAVAAAYDDLASCNHQKVSKHQKHIRLNFDPRKRFEKKELAPSILGLVAGKGRGNNLKIHVH